MDPLAFDRRVRCFAHASSRRRLFAALATLSGGAVAGRTLWPVASAPAPAAAAPKPAKNRARHSPKRGCRAKGGRYFGPGEARPCAATCDANPTRFPCAIGPECSCFTSATGGAICGDETVVEFPAGCATNADCIKSGLGTQLCVLMSCIHPDGQPCGPGLPPCPGGENQACLSGRCRYTGCVKACG